VGLREVWYFGLQYTDNKGFLTWLKLDKKVFLILYRKCIVFEPVFAPIRANTNTKTHVEVPLLCFFECNVAVCECKRSAKFERSN